MAIAIFVLQNGSRIANPEPYLETALVISLGWALLAMAASFLVEPKTVGVFLGVAGYVFFSATWIPISWPIYLSFAMWLLASIVATELVTWLVASSPKTFYVSTSVIVLICLGTVGLTVGQRGGSATTEPADLAFQSDLVRTPNVYFIISDAFGRPDVIAEESAGFGVDYASSLARLRELGVEISTESESNYVGTILSVPSMLSGNYPITSKAEWNSQKIFDQGNRILGGDNATVDWFRARGYEYWHANNGPWDNSHCSDDAISHCLGVRQKTPRSLVDLTPLRVNYPSGFPSYKRLMPEPFADEVIELLNRTSGTQPKFVFGHIMSPHYPFMLRSDCSDFPPEGRATYNHDTPEVRKQYGGQSVCILTRLTSAIESIVEADPSAIIVVQGDHGPRFSLTYTPEKWTDENAKFAFSALRLVLMPDECFWEDWRAKYAINTLPAIRGCLEGREPAWIEPRQFLASGDTSYVREIELSEDS